jgi:methylglutaconyl-CoA hydratase
MINDNGYVKQQLENGVLTIEFFHPQSNSLPAELLNNLAESFKDASQNENVKLVILRSAGTGAFCAGASFEELAAISNEAEGLAFFSGFAHLINSMRNCTKLIIGRIHGKCAGGGVGLAAACDYAFALSGAGIKLSELAVGIGPFVVGPVVERKIGIAAFSQLAIDAGSWRSSDWAFHKGLFASVHPGNEQMDAAITTLSNTLQQASPHAMAAIKKITWQGTEHWEKLLLERAAISGSLVLSSYTKKAIAAFKAKKK